MLLRLLFYGALAILGTLWYRSSVPERVSGAGMLVDQAWAAVRYENTVIFVIGATVIGGLAVWGFEFMLRRDRRRYR